VAGELVLLEDDRVGLALRYLDRDDLLVEDIVFLRGLGALLGFGGEGVLTGTAELIFLGDVLRRHAHVALVEDIRQTLGNHAVDHLPVAHLHPIA
jgi:hypothetical protein